MAQPESRLSKKVQQALRAKGAFCFKVHGSEYMMAGLPDVICCYRGYFLSFELKVPGKEHNTSARQRYVIEQIQAAEGIAMVISSVIEVEALLAAIDDYQS